MVQFQLICMIVIITELCAWPDFCSLCMELSHFSSVVSCLPFWPPSMGGRWNINSFYRDIAVWKFRLYIGKPYIPVTRYQKDPCLLIAIQVAAVVRPPGQTLMISTVTTHPCFQNRNTAKIRDLLMLFLRTIWTSLFWSCHNVDIRMKIYAPTKRKSLAHFDFVSLVSFKFFSSEISPVYFNFL
jgi:hypothetical protein